MKKLIILGFLALTAFTTLGCDNAAVEEKSKDTSTDWFEKVGTRYYLKSYQIEGQNEIQVDDPSKAWLKIQGEDIVRGKFICNNFDAEVLMKSNGTLIFKDVSDKWDVCEKDNIRFRFYKNDAFKVTFLNAYLYLEDEFSKLTFSTSPD